MPISSRTVWTIAALAGVVLGLTILLGAAAAALGHQASRMTGDRVETNARSLVLTQASPSPNPTPAPKTGVPNHIIEQYKAYIADLASVGTQQAATDTFFLTMLSALVAVLAFKGMPRPEDYFTIASIVVFVFVFLACVIWFLTKQQFDNLLGAKFELLRLMEKDYPDLYPLFTEQTKLYKNHIGYGIIRHLSALPAVFGLGALVIVCIGVRSQVGAQKARKQALAVPAAPPDPNPGGPID